MERLMLGFITVMNTKKKNAAIRGNNKGKIMDIIQKNQEMKMVRKYTYVEKFRRRGTPEGPFLRPVKG